MYPKDLDLQTALEMLLATCESLKFKVGSDWDTAYPHFYYLERNMRWAKTVLERTQHE